MTHEEFLNLKPGDLLKTKTKIFYRFNSIDFHVPLNTIILFIEVKHARSKNIDAFCFLKGKIVNIFAMNTIYKVVDKIC